MKYLIASLLLLSCIIFCTTCKKEYSYEGGNATGVISVPFARFTLAGAPNQCGNIVINGTYVAGQAFTSSNEAVVNVNVISPGSYTIYTDTTDGISFSASGIFTNTGNQNVTLTGSGTPQFPKDLVFTIFTSLAGVPGCTFGLSVGPFATYVLESSSGILHSCTYSLHGNYTPNVSLSVSNTVSIRLYVTEVGNFTIATNSVNGITFSYTGTFTNTGFQFVILSGSGTPVTQGSYTFTPQIIGPHPIGGEACSFVIDVL